MTKPPKGGACVPPKDATTNPAQRAYPGERPGGLMAESYSGEAYCVKCKEKRAFSGEVHETNGRRMAKGKCPVCNTTVTRILGKQS
ncbi:MAG: DUF5679 domain-containing protein [Candidatus Nanopelagicales bacterium]